MSRFNPDIVADLSDGINASIDAQHDISDNELIDAKNMEYFDDSALITRRGVFQCTADAFGSHITSVHGFGDSLLVTTGDKVYSAANLDPVQWVAGGEGTTTLAYSRKTSPTSFTAVSVSPFSTRCNCIAYNGSRWVAVGAGTNSIAYSDDGASWTGLGNLGAAENMGVCWNGNKWIVFGRDDSTDTIQYSYNGVDWTGLGGTIWGAGGSGSNEARKIAWNGTYFVGVGSSSITKDIAYSIDGIAWTSLGDVISGGATQVAWGNSRWVVVGSKSTHLDTISYSTVVSGASGWTGEGATVFSTAGGSVAWNGVDLFVAVGSGTNTVAYSSDGLSWTGDDPFPAAWSGGPNVAWNGELWIAAGTGTDMFISSPDGIAWSFISGTAALFTTKGLAIASRVAPGLIPAIS